MGSSLNDNTQFLTLFSHRHAFLYKGGKYCRHKILNPFSRKSLIDDRY